MKILFDNMIKGATISALNPNANYSVDNLRSQFLRLKFKSLGVSDTITITFTDNITANSFFYGYSNVNAMTVKLYSNTSVLLNTLIVDCSQDNGSAFFEQVNNLRWIVIEASCPVTQDLYIGGIACGYAFTPDDPLASLVQGITDLSSISTSGEGQVSNRFIEPIKTYQAQFTNMEKEKFYQLLALFHLIGSGHVWVDFTERNHMYHEPLYATTKLIEGEKKERDVSFNINFTEAR